MLLYELLTGTTPLTHEALRQAALDEVLRRIREQEPPKPSTRLSQTRDRLGSISAQRKLDPVQLRKLLQGDLDWIVMKSLEKERNRRYDTANNLAADIQRHLEDRAVLARPPSAAYQLQKAWRRNKVVFAAVAAVAAALVLGLTASLWQASRATQESRRAKKAEGEAEQKAHLADRERESADLQRTNAERNLYFDNMNLLQTAWEQNNLVRVRQLLDETASFPQRGFEWYYWQRQTHLELKTLRGHLYGVTSVAFSADGQRIVTGGGDQTAKVWEAASGKELLTLEGHGGGVRSVVFSPDGQRIVTGSADKTAKVWEAASGKELLTLKGHGGIVASVAFSLDGQRIVTSSDDQTAKVWEAASGHELLTLKGHHRGVFSVAFSPDGQRIVTGSGDNTAKIWEAASGKELLTLKGHGHYVDSVAFSPDGQRIVTGSGEERIGKVPRSGDNTARVWEAASGKELLTLKGHHSSVLCVAFSPDGQRIVTGSSDRTAKVWEAATPAQVARWQAEEQAAAEHLAALAREQERQQDELRTRGRKSSEIFVPGAVPPRDSRSRASQIDLSRYYNAGLTQSWHWGTGKSDLAALPQGIQKFASVEFDVRGLIQAGWWSRTQPYPTVVAGIAVERKCERLHFLHAAVNAVGVTNGTQIGRYTIHRSSGETNEIPLIIGEQMAHWREQTNEAGGSLVAAWMQSAESAAKDNKQPARLFKLTWENPSPEVAIKSIDLISTQTNAAPFVVAITAEP